MKRLRWLSVLLLVLYVFIAFAVDIHVHDGKDQSALHCQLCQISNLSLTQTFAPHCSPGIVDLGVFNELQKPLFVPNTIRASFGRAPPLS